MNERGGKNWLMANAKGGKECEGKSKVKETGGQQRNGSRAVCLCGREGSPSIEMGR